MHELKLFDIHDKETRELLMTIEARDCEEAVRRIVLTGGHVKHLRTPGGNVLVYEHDTETLVNAPYFFREGFFLMLASATATQH